MLDALIWLVKNIFFGLINPFLFLFGEAKWSQYGQMDWIVRLIYFGASAEFFFLVFDLFLIVLVIGFFKRNFLWSFVRVAEKIGNSIGRFAAWAILLMVFQQVIIVALQRMFRVSEITFGPFGYALTKDVSWYAEELKLYNAIIVALCVSYTFIQGGHVRVDLIYSAVNFRTRKIIDMFGSLFFVLPFMTLVWLYGWFFMWRHLVRPPINPTYDLSRLERMSKFLKWDVETIGFSPNGFNGYFLFKVLLVIFAALMFLQAISFFYRSLLEYLEGQGSADKYMDFDRDREQTALEQLKQRKLAELEAYGLAGSTTKKSKSTKRRKKPGKPKTAKGAAG